jgi:hypothetical protein
MKFTTDRPYGDPEKAARKLVEIANAVEPAQDSRIFIELINWPFLHDLKGNPAEYKAGLELAIAKALGEAEAEAEAEARTMSGLATFKRF